MSLIYFFLCYNTTTTLSVRLINVKKTNMLKKLQPFCITYLYRTSMAVATTEYHHIRSVFILQYTVGDEL